ncbi:hypothetical protein PDUR_10865 [Paenibacillus durus]|uniref:Uncharacterized protein n=1 Tax=Paenibacillus durus TaxID=44251 RepID=A0A089HK75_PAEDU|nr:hypothetical protein PDUR_10865 [Paenibacillus durus]
MRTGAKIPIPGASQPSRQPGAKLKIEWLRGRLSYRKVETGLFVIFDMSMFFCDKEGFGIYWSE